jgi:hypothetical protein
MEHKFHCRVHKVTLHTRTCPEAKQPDTYNSISSRSFPIPTLRRRNLRIYILLNVNVDSMSELRFNVDTLYVVPISASLIVLN